MTPEEVNHARRQHNLPLDSEAETEQPVQPKQEPMNFRITDDDLGAGGAEDKISKQTSKPSGCCKRWMQNSGRPPQKNRKFFPGMSAGAAFRRRSTRRMRTGRKEYAELKSLLPADEYKRSPRQYTLNAFLHFPYGHQGNV